MAERAGVTGRRGRRWVLVLRLAVSAALLGLLVSRVPAGSWPPVTATTVALLAAALAVLVGTTVLGALRWAQVTHLLRLPGRFVRLLGHAWAGLFVGNVLPTTVGGDVLRAARLGADSGRTADATASVVLDRMTGWAVLPALVLVGLALEPSLLGTPVAGPAALGLALGTLTLLVVTVVAARHPSEPPAPPEGTAAPDARDGAPGSPHAATRPADHPTRRDRWVAGWRRFVASASRGLVRVRREPRATARIVGAGLAYQLTAVLATLLAARAVGVDVPWTTILAFSPAVLIVQVLPIGIAGLGVREGAWVLFLEPLGVPVEDAVALGLALFGLAVAVSAPGVVPFALAPGRRAAPAPEAASRRHGGTVVARSGVASPVPGPADGRLSGREDAATP